MAQFFYVHNIRINCIFAIHKKNKLWAEVTKKQKQARYLKALLGNLEVAKQKKLLQQKQKRKHKAFFFYVLR